MALVTKKMLSERLPNEGDIVIEKITTHGHPTNQMRERVGVVVYVNREHLWYQVEFNLGTYVVREGHKFPYICFC